MCNKDYYFSSVTNKCVAVDTANKVTNCAVYNASQACISCDASYYIDSGKCVAPTTTIANCEFYQTATTCSACKKGYYAALDAKSCTALPGTANCFYFSRFKCLTCATGFVNNANLYFTTAFNTNNATEKNVVLNNIVKYKNSLKGIWETPVCQAVTVTNCATFETYKTCKVCTAGYFLTTTKTCQVYPTDIILNCLTYSGKLTCSKCNQGFYLANNLCKAITAIDNCSLYSQTANTTQCTTCNADFYLQNNACVARVNSKGTLIANCKTKAPTADKCLTCNTNFFLSSDGVKCFAVLSNCKEHNATSSTATTYTCKTCNDGFYLNGTTCTAGTDTNCITFKTNVDACEVCKSGFYHPSNTCVQHVTIANCKTYSQTDAHTCLTCENNTYNFLIAKYCKNLNEIANCATYNNGTNDTTSTCTACASGYQLSNNACSSITISNCAAVDNNGVCTKCKAGFTLFKYTANANEVVECRQAHDYLADQCEVLVTENGGNTQEIKDVTCTSCKKNAFPLDYNKAYACISNDYLKGKHVAITTQITNCLKYEADGKCSLCGNGYFLKNDGTACLSGGCGANGAAATFQAVTVDNDGATPKRFFVKNNNFCVTDAPHVLVRGPDMKDGTTIIDLKCDSGKMTAIDKAEDQYSVVNPDGSFGTYVSSPRAVYPKVSCPVDANVTHINGVAGQTLIANCSYYYEYDGTNHAKKYGCLRCDHGNSGKAHADGYISSCVSNSVCDSSTTYHNIPPYWQKYFSCHKCTTSGKIPYVAYEGASTSA